ncbi:MAG TPA: hypothetical protein VGB94_11805 [Acidobacteriaceae bacterium]
MFRRLSLRISIALSASILTFALAGCGIGGSLPSQSSQTATSPSAPAAVPGKLVGIAHGGRQPISNGLVTLWAAGTTTGYGQGATYVASTNTSTDGGGTFDLDLPSTTTSPCTAGQLNYITITGGDPGGGINSSSALLLALPSLCSPAVTGGLSVYVNEITTVASVWSLQQFMSITAYAPPFSGTTPVWNIGAPASNVTGLQNAFAQVASLVNISSAVSASSVVASTVTGGSTPSTFYTIVSPDSQRIYMLADILAACVNTTDNAGDTASTVCSKLFAAVVPSAATPPADTIQAAYDIAIAPGGITEYPEAAIAGGMVPVGTALTNPAPSCSSSSVGCTWALNLCNDFVVPNTPFPLTTSCTQGTASVATYPNDFAIGIRWSAYDNNGRRYGVSHGDAAADSKGNVWTAATTLNASSTGNPLVQWDPQGHVLQAVGGSFTMPSSSISAQLVNGTSSGGLIAGGPYSFSFSSPPSVTLGPATSAAPFAPFGLAVDTNNNAWISAYAAATVGGAALSSTPSGQSFYPGLLLQVAPATVTTSGTPTSAAYSSVTAVSGTGSTATITTANSFTAGESIELFGFATDTAFNGQTFTVASATPTSFTISGTVTTTDTGYAIPAITHATSTAGTATPHITGSTPGPIAIDSANNIWVGSRANGTGTYGYTQLLLMTSASNYLNVYQNQQGSSPPYVVMVDGLNNYAWVTSNQSAPGKAIYRSSIATAATTAGTLNISGTNYAAATPTGLAPRFGALDNASNLWIAEGIDGSASGQIAYFNVPLTGFNPLPAGDIFYKTASSGAGTSGAKAYTGGLNAPDAVGVDGVGNIFFSNAVSSGGAGLSEFSPSGAPLSPTNASTGMPAFGFNDFTSNTPAAATIDLSGNLWIGANATYVVHMVGIAAPVITPTSSAVAPATAVITAWSIDSSGTVATFTVQNVYTVGEKILLSGFGTSTFFNGQTVIVTAATSTTFTATVTGGTASTSGTEIGVASTSRLGTRP